jgi:hypothetical protein
MCRPFPILLGSPCTLHKRWPRTLGLVLESPILKLQFASISFPTIFRSDHGQDMGSRHPTAIYLAPIDPCLCVPIRVPLGIIDAAREAPEVGLQGTRWATAAGEESWKLSY